MNLYELFNENEKSKILGIARIQDKNYTKEEISLLENKILDTIMNESKDNISKVREEYSSIIDKLESCKL